MFVVMRLTLTSWKRPWMVNPTILPNPLYRKGVPLKQYIGGDFSLLESQILFWISLQALRFPKIAERTNLVEESWKGLPFFQHRNKYLIRALLVLKSLINSLCINLCDGFNYVTLSIQVLLNISLVGVMFFQFRSKDFCQFLVFMKHQFFGDVIIENFHSNWQS